MTDRPMIADRVSRLRAALEGAGLDAILVGSAANRRWASGFTGSAGWALVSGDGAWLSTDSRYWEQAGRQCDGFEVHRQDGGMATWLPDLLARVPKQRVGFEAGQVAVATHKQMRDAVAGMPAPRRPGLVQTDGLIEELRAIKDADELAAIRRAAALGDAAFADVAGRLEPGWTETKVAWEIERYAREHGAEAMSFPTIVGAGPWGAMPHAFPRDEAIPAGVPIVIDMGVVVDGYCSDMTRTVVLGEPDAEFARVYDIVLTAQETAEELLEGGMSGREVHMLAQNVIAEAGHGEHFGHGLGHGVGLEIHELPRIGRQSADAPLTDGMVITVEPGIYLPGWGGVRIEDMGVIQDGRFHNFTTAPKLRMGAASAPGGA